MQYPETSLWTHLSHPAADILDRITNSHREASPLRLTPYEVDIVALEKPLEDTRDTRKGKPHSKVTQTSLKMVVPGRKYSSRPTITPPQSYVANLYRRTKRRMGHSLRGIHYKEKLVPSGKQAIHKLPGTKSGFPVPKRVTRPLLEQHSSHSYRQHYSDCFRVAPRALVLGPSGHVK